MCDSRMEVLYYTDCIYILELKAKQPEFCVWYLVRRKAKLMVLPHNACCVAMEEKAVWFLL